MEDLTIDQLPDDQIDFLTTEFARIENEDVLEPHELGNLVFSQVNKIIAVYKKTSFQEGKVSGYLIGVEMGKIRQELKDYNHDWKTISINYPELMWLMCNANSPYFELDYYKDHSFYLEKLIKFRMFKTQ